GQVKLLDFGVAKLLESTDDPQLTVGTRGPFTHRYASPEQLRGEALSVGTDVYSLGLLLYELLTDRRPFASVEEGRPDPRVTGALPAPPSTVRALPPELDTSSRAAWRDLDAIVLAALAPDVDRRYRSVADLAADLQRLRDGRPVSARSPSMLYRTRLSVRRHPTISALIVLVALSLLLGVVVSTHQAQRAEHQRRQAEQLADHVLDILRLADPRAGGSTTLTARQLLESSARGLDELDDPEVKARLQAVLGEGLLHLDVYEPAVEHLMAAARQRGFPETIDGTTADLLSMVATAEASRGDLPTALERIAPAIAYRESVASNAQTRIELAEALHHRAFLMARFTTTSAPDRPEVRRQLERAIELLRAQRSDDHEPLAKSLHLYGQELFAQARAADGGPDEAATRRGLAVMTEAADMRRRLDAAHDTATAFESLNDLALAYDTIGELDTAIPLLDEALDRAETHLSTGHPDRLMMQSNLAGLYRERGDWEDAATLYDAALDGWRAAGLEPAAQPLYGLGLVRAQQDRLVEAEDLLRRALGRLDPSHPAHWIVGPLLGDVLRRQGQLDEAEALLRQAVERTEALLGADSEHHALATRALAALVRERDAD
ncbi:MAG: tetratricopeptide repeat protein, partial [Acidobacteriota bacterium]